MLGRLLKSRYLHRSMDIYFETITFSYLFEKLFPAPDFRSIEGYHFFEIHALK